MSCSYSSANADPANETLPSALSNLINDFYGNLTKTVVNGKVVWELPCDLSTGLESNPRQPGEGTACYLKRLVEESLTQLSNTVSGQPAFGTDLEGGDLFVQAGAGTGAGSISSLYLRAPVVGGSGTTGQTQQVLAELKADQTVTDAAGMWVHFWDGANWQQKRVFMGAADSGGTGYRVMRVLN